MSTKAIRELAQWVKAEYGGAIEEMADKALSEAVSIERAAKAAETHGWLDFCRDKFMVHRDEEAALHLMESIAKDAP